MNEVVKIGFGHLLSVQVAEKLVAVVGVDCVQLQLHLHMSTLISIHFSRGRLRAEQ
jgi:hypothetical protein